MSIHTAIRELVLLTIDMSMMSIINAQLLQVLVPILVAEGPFFGC